MAPIRMVRATADSGPREPLREPDQPAHEPSAL
jgi:hypothetical protein